LIILILAGISAFRCRLHLIFLDVFYACIVTGQDDRDARSAYRWG